MAAFSNKRDVKLRAASRALASSGSGEPAPLTESEIEILARMEHNGWWADRALDGWIFGSPRNDSKKVHPDMVAYEKLDDGTKNYDRISVKQWSRFSKRKAWKSSWVRVQRPTQLCPSATDFKGVTESIKCQFI